MSLFLNYPFLTSESKDNVRRLTFRGTVLVTQLVVTVLSPGYGPSSPLLCPSCPRRPSGAPGCGFSGEFGGH